MKETVKGGQVSASASSGYRFLTDRHRIKSFPGEVGTRSVAEPVVRRLANFVFPQNGLKANSLALGQERT
jgi:hypothetical protein